MPEGRVLVIGMKSFLDVGVSMNRVIEERVRICTVTVVKLKKSVALR